jgi:gamma-glutamylputrescine oxidase
METATYVDSYYAASAHSAPRRPPLAGTFECDVGVIGGGFAGTSAALHLAERGYKVALLEERRIGWGASGRNGGQVLPGIAKGQEELERLVGVTAARMIWDATVEGIDLIRSQIQRHRIECDWTPGHMLVALKPRHEAELRAERETLERGYGYHSFHWMDRNEVRGTLATDRYIAGLYDSNAGHLHPLNYTLGLAAAAEHAGTHIFEHTRALGHETRDGLVHVRTPNGALRCRHLVLCGNVYLGDLAPALRAKIMAIGTFIVATERLGAGRVRALVRNRAAVADMNWIIDYFRPTADTRLLFGGRVSYAGLDSFRTSTATRARMLAVFPQLADVRIEHAWGGFLDITLNRAPHFGRLTPNIYFAQGFSGHGVVLTGVAGKLIAEAIAGTAERFDVFARIPHRGFPGGMALRRPALMLAMLYYRLRDLL